MTEPSAPSPNRQQDAHCERISRPAEHCFRLFHDARRIPEWLPGVRAARSRHHDDEGRPLEVEYLASAERGGYVYTVRYVYLPADLTVTWESGDQAALRQVTGAATFMPLGHGECDLLYETSVEVSAALPAWAMAPQQDRPAEQLCRAFRAWVEKQPW
jgi:uncharacterized protein YndB with AHSA1/START domain